jgi:hypothetical protein
MAGFPLMWEEEKLGPPAEDGCPVTEPVIADYLERCSYYHLREFEPPLKFGRLKRVLRRHVEARDFWIFTCLDGVERQWFVVVSAGDDEPKRWVYAISNEDRQSAEWCLEFTLAEMRLGEGNSK